jgi:hypothetical protein
VLAMLELKDTRISFNPYALQVNNLKINIHWINTNRDLNFAVFEKPFWPNYKYVAYIQ